MPKPPELRKKDQEKKDAEETQELTPEQKKELQVDHSKASGPEGEANPNAQAIGATCGNCRGSVTAGMRFCPGCGAPQEGWTPPPPAKPYESNLGKPGQPPARGTPQDRKKARYGPAPGDIVTN